MVAYEKEVFNCEHCGEFVSRTTYRHHHDEELLTIVKIELDDSDTTAR